MGDGKLVEGSRDIADIVPPNKEDGLESAGFGEDLEFEVSTPRLNTPFYEALKKKYPQAFKRRTSVSSQASDTASVCSDSSFSSAFALSAAHTVKRPRPLPPVTANQDSCKEGLPPLPPGGRSRKQGENDDFSIVGSPRRGRLKRLAAKAAKSERSQEVLHMDKNRSGNNLKTEGDENHQPDCHIPSLSKNGEQYTSISSLHSEMILADYDDERPGKLQKGGLYSSSRSLQLTTEDSGVLRNRLHKADSTQSLKEKLKQNQESWKKLLAASNSPFKDTKPRIRSRDSRGRKQEKVSAINSARSEMGNKNSVLMNDVMRTLEDIQNKMTLQADLAKRKRVQNLSRSQTPNNDFTDDEPVRKGNHFLPVLTNTQISGLDDLQNFSTTATTTTGAQKINRHGKRLQSPDSHDSAVDLDSVSLQSSPPVSDITRTSQINNNQQHKPTENVLTKGGEGDGSRRIQTSPEDLRINLNFLKEQDNSGATNSVSSRRKHKRNPDKVSSTPEKEGRYMRDNFESGAKLNARDNGDESGSNFVSSAFLKLDANGDEEEKILTQGFTEGLESRIKDTAKSLHKMKAERTEKLSPKVEPSKHITSRDSDDSGFDGLMPQNPNKYSHTSSHDSVKRQHSAEGQGETSSEKSSSAIQSSSRLHKLRSRQKSQESKPTASAPLKADHRIVTPRGDSSEGEILPKRPHSALREPISSSAKELSKNRPRSASVDSRKNRVVFEDEISDDPSKPMFRTGSQPLLYGGSNTGGISVAAGIVGNNNDHNSLSSQRKFHSDQDLPSSGEGDEFKRNSGNGSTTQHSSDITKMTEVESHGQGRNVSTTAADVQKLSYPPIMPKPSQGTPHKVQKMPKLKDNSSTAGSLKQRIANTNVRRASVSSNNDTDINEEVAMITSALEESSGNDGQKGGRPKLPWKKNKGRYTPSEEIEKAQMQAVKNASQKSHWSSLYLASKAKQELPNHRADDISAANGSDSTNLNLANESEGYKTPPIKPPRTKKVTKQKGKTKAEVAETRNVRGKGHYEDVVGYEEMELGQRSSLEKAEKQEAKRTSSGSDGGGIRKRQTEGDYEDIGVYQEKDQDITPRQDVARPEEQSEVDAVYAVVQKRQGRARTKTPAVPAAFADDTEDEEIYTRPPVPERGYESNLKASKELSGSRSSLMDSFKDSAKKRFGQLRRALSVEKLTKDNAQEAQDSGKVKKSPSLRSLFGKKKSGSYEIGSPEEDTSSRPQLRSSSLSALNRVELPKHYRQLGKILSVSPDGTQVIELMKPPHGPFGFFIARGTAKYNHGIFVSRLGDGLPEHFFAGLLGIGDEILEINGLPLQKMALDDIYDLMGLHDKLTLKVLPFVSRKDS